jgi:hypothetical protein
MGYNAKRVQNGMNRAIKTAGLVNPKLIGYHVTINGIRQDGVINAPKGSGRSIDALVRSEMGEGVKVVITTADRNWAPKPKLSGGVGKAIMAGVIGQNLDEEG